MFQIIFYLGNQNCPGKQNASKVPKVSKVIFISIALVALLAEVTNLVDFVLLAS